MIKIVRGLGCALLMLAGLTWSAAAEGLFTQLASADAGAAASRQTPDLAVVRSNDVQIDPAYLSATVAPAGVDGVAGRLDLAPPASTVRIELFPGSVVDLNRTSLTEAFGGGFVWTGESANSTGHAGNLVVRNGLVTGIVDYGGRTYRIDPLGLGGAHRISELDGRGFPGDIVIPVPTRDAPRGPDRFQAAGDTDITILVPYTTRARDSVADIVAQANLAVSRANTGFAASQVTIAYRLVGTILVNGYDETAVANYDAVLNDLSAGTASGPFQPVHALRNSAGADLVVLLHNRTEYCGLGYLVETPTGSTSAYGLSAVTTSCITNESFTHETGHNMGLDHDRYVVTPTPPDSQYNFGFVSLPGQFRDIMAYNNQCAAQQPPFTCTRQNFFSNPNLTFQGQATGIPQGSPGAADNARRLNETKAGIASYRAGTPPPPPPSASIVSAVTPVARSTSVNGTVTAFATILNTGNATATNCGIALPGGFGSVVFSFSARNVNTGAPENPNVPVNIAAGGGRNFVMSFRPTTTNSASIPLVFDCTNTNPAASVAGLNTFLLTGTATPPADLVSIAVTATNDGIMNVPLGGTGFASLAAVNIGAGANLQARLSPNPIGVTGRTLAATLSMCQTNPNNGQCITGQASILNFASNANQTVTFSAFVTSNGQPIAFDPATKRLFVHFFQGNNPVGSASVAVRTTGPDASVTALAD